MLCDTFSTPKSPKVPKLWIPGVGYWLRAFFCFYINVVTWNIEMNIIYIIIFSYDKKRSAATLWRSLKKDIQSDFVSRQVERKSLAMVRLHLVINKRIIGNYEPRGQDIMKHISTHHICRGWKRQYPWSKWRNFFNKYFYVEQKFYCVVE